METPTIIKFVKKGDTVQVRIGKDRGKTGKVVRVLSDRGKVIVEGLNLVKKHVRPKREGEKGETVQVPRAIPVSNVAPFCGTCKRGTRVGFRIEEGGSKVRFCKRCKAIL